MAPDTPAADVDAETSESDTADVPQCTVVAEETGEWCGNPAILGTRRCHTHLDFTELPAADSSDEVGGEPSRRQATTSAKLARSRVHGGSK